MTQIQQARDAAQDTLTITICETGTTTEMVARGEWDLAEEKAARNAIRNILERRPQCIVLALNQLSFIDSSGIHNVLELHRHSAEHDIHLVIIRAPEAVQRTCELCRLTALLPFVGAGV